MRNDHVFLEARSLVEWLNDHPDLLDEPFIAPEGKYITGVAHGANGIYLFTEVAVPENETEV